MKSNLKDKDLALQRVNNLDLKDIIQNNLSLKSVYREAQNLLKINTINADYLFSEKGKIQIRNLSTSNKTKFCKLIAGVRHKELLTQVEEKI